jgi:hypothetical protein
MAYLRHIYDGIDAKEVTWFVVNRKDIFVIEYLYLLMHEWLLEHGYTTTLDVDFPEKYYWHREGPAGKEIWWRWRPKRYPLGPNKMWRFDLNIDVHVLPMKDVEVVLGGKKFKVNQGEVEVQVKAMLVKDPDKLIEKSMFKDVKKLMFNRMWKQQFDALEREFYREAYEFRDAMNAFLQIETFLPSKEWAKFWPTRLPETER